MVAEATTGKWFNLMRYFVLASLAVLIGVALLSALAFGVLMRRALIGEAEGDAVALAHFMAAEFDAELREMAREGLDLRWDDPQVQRRLSEVFVRSGGSLGVIKIKAFDGAGQIVYSTDLSLIGQMDAGNPDLQEAMAGRVSSSLAPAETVADLTGETFVVDVIETYVPVLEAGSSIRAFEIYQDATDIQHQVRVAQRLVAALVGGVTLLLFVLLFLIVRRADRIIARQRAELETAYTGLRRLEQLKSDLTHMIVHDLKNPLTSIGGYADLLPTAGPLNEMQNRFLQVIRQSSQRLLTMIRNLLDISRLEEGKLELQREALPVRQIVEPIVPEIAPLLAREEKSLHLDLPEDLPLLWGDRDLLVRVVSNLLSNAEKHTERGGNLWVTARPGGTPGTLLLSVRDDGEGIPAEYHEVIFEKFGQAANRRLGRQTDTGLGLTFCKLVVEAHGGTIAVESTVGQGSTFLLTLPTIGSASTASGQSASGYSASGQSASETPPTASGYSASETPPTAGGRKGG